MSIGVDQVTLNNDSIDDVIEMVDSGAAYEIGRMVTLIDLFRQLHLKPVFPWVQKLENN